MSLITLSDIHKFYGKQDVLRSAGFAINVGERAGLVGPNGAGKSTILRLILDEIVPDEGAVHKARGLRLGYLPQDLMAFSGTTLLDMVMDTAEDLRAIEADLSKIHFDIEVESEKAAPDQDLLLELTDRQGRLMSLFESLGGYTLEAEARKILHGLGFTEHDMMRRVEEFSGGWIMRAVLARLLLSGPDLLLLDEPTNHLDIDSLLWLEGYLLHSASSLLLVSHDRVFLNNVINRVIEVDRGRTITYNGNYDNYLEEKEKRRTTEAAAFENQQDRIKQMEKFIERNKVRASTARRAQSRMKMLDKMDRLESPVSAKTRSFKLDLPPAPRSPEIMVELSGITKSYANNTIYKDLDFSVRRGDRIAFLGANGRGKSTLMKLISGSLEYDQGARRVGTGVVMSYFAQFQLEELNPDNNVLEELASVAGDLSQGRLRSILGGFMFREEDVFKKVSVLSGGEKSRLIMAKIMIVGPNLLLLDEPSNHLDIPGREMLEQALRKYSGTLCLISHDRRLVNAVANKVLIIEGRGVDVFPGNFDDYHNLWLQKIEQSSSGGEDGAPDEPDEPQKPKKGGRAEREAIKKQEAERRQMMYKLTKPLKKDMDKLESRLEEMTARLDGLSAVLAEPETYQDADKFRTLHQEYNTLKAKVDAETAKWEEVALKIEEIEEEYGG